MKNSVFTDSEQNSIISSCRKEECFLLGKNNSEVCGDYYLKGKNFCAIADGATPKYKQLFDGKAGDVFISHFLIEQLEQLDPNADALTAFEFLSGALMKYYEKNGVEINVETLPQASVVIYSRAKKEIWSYGDCQFCINNVPYTFVKRVDEILSEVRSLYLETEFLLGKTKDDIVKEDTGRAFILPLLSRQSMFANNADSPYGYPVLNGFPIVPEFLKTVSVECGDHVVLASDGYPKLFDTLKESEEYLKNELLNDPLCISTNCSTKGVSGNNISFDDRSYLSFFVK